MKLALNLKPALLFNQFVFYRQELPQHAPECFKQLLIKRDGRNPAGQGEEGRAWYGSKLIEKNKKADSDTFGYVTW